MWHIVPLLLVWPSLTGLKIKRPLQIYFIFSVLLLGDVSTGSCPLVGRVLSLVSCSCLFACFPPRGLGGVSQRMESTALRSTAQADILLSLIRPLSLTYPPPLPSQVSGLSLSLSIYLNFLNPRGHSWEGAVSPEGVWCVDLSVCFIMCCIITPLSF